MDGLMNQILKIFKYKKEGALYEKKKAKTRIF